MVDFFKGIFEKIKSAFTSKDLEGNIANFQTRIDAVISDLILPYTNPTQLSPDDKFRDLVTLLDSKNVIKLQ